MGVDATTSKLSSMHFHGWQLGLSSFNNVIGDFSATIIGWWFPKKSHASLGDVNEFNGLWQVWPVENLNGDILEFFTVFVFSVNFINSRIIPDWLTHGHGIDLVFFVEDKSILFNHWDVILVPSDSWFWLTSNMSNKLKSSSGSDDNSFVVFFIATDNWSLLIVFNNDPFSWCTWVTSANSVGTFHSESDFFVQFQTFNGPFTFIDFIGAQYISTFTVSNDFDGVSQQVWFGFRGWWLPNEGDRVVGDSFDIDAFWEVWDALWINSEESSFSASFITSTVLVDSSYSNPVLLHLLESCNHAFFNIAMGINLLPGFSAFFSVFNNVVRNW